MINEEIGHFDNITQIGVDFIDGTILFYCISCNARLLIRKKFVDEYSGRKIIQCFCNPCDCKKNRR